VALSERRCPDRAPTSDCGCCHRCFRPQFPLPSRWLPPPLAAIRGAHCRGALPFFFFPTAPPLLLAHTPPLLFLMLCRRRRPEPDLWAPSPRHQAGASSGRQGNPSGAPASFPPPARSATEHLTGVSFLHPLPGPVELPMSFAPAVFCSPTRRLTPVTPTPACWRPSPAADPLRRGQAAPVSPPPRYTSSRFPTSPCSPSAPPRYTSSSAVAEFRPAITTRSGPAPSPILGLRSKGQMG
jgi:hypothetical protein